MNAIGIHVDRTITMHFRRLRTRLGQVPGMWLKPDLSCS